MTAIRDLGTDVVGNPASDLAALSALLGISVQADRAIAMHANASPELLKQLSNSIDKQTLRNVVLNPQTPITILLKLAPTFPGEFFLNPVFDLLLMENPNLIFELPIAVIKNEGPLPRASRTSASATSCQVAAIRPAAPPRPALQAMSCLATWWRG